MSDFSGMEELLQDFLQESSELLDDVDSKLLMLEQSPHDHSLLNDIFRGFHTIKGGAGFLNATELVTLCHLTENLFDRLRNDQLALDAVIMDAILAATSEVRHMFGALSQNTQPSPAPLSITRVLEAILEGKSLAKAAPSPPSAPPGPDWNALFAALTAGTSPQPPPPIVHSAQDKSTVNAPSPNVNSPPDIPDVPDAPQEIKSYGRRATDTLANATPSGRRESENVKENTIRVDTERLDQVLNLSGEIGLTKNRLNQLRSDILLGKQDANTLRALDEAVNQLDMLVVSLQNSVMKTRMQPIGRLFKKFPRLARDLARQLNKEVELVLVGEETEIDKTMIEDLNDPLVHLIRNAVDHGVELPSERTGSGKPVKSLIHLQARQIGDHINIIIADDGKGMDPEAIRAKAIAKGLISPEVASSLDETQCLELIFLPGFSTKDQISSVSGRGVGMDVVKTNIKKLNGNVTIRSEVGKGSELTISLPLTLAILPVLMVRIGTQSFAVPLSLVREIIALEHSPIQHVGGKTTLVVRGEILPMVSLAQLLHWEESNQAHTGVLMQVENQSFILSVDGFDGHDDVVIKSLDTFRPNGVAGVTMSSDGEIVLILDIKELFGLTGGGIVSH
ncbi:MAG: chemotaxis protein CheA [Ferrovum sp.]|jgi:two-component system chemotaxis sensor kinase CheA|nr:chemotaxis protein CheA [Ferrovum sp.]NDU88271.1 chemotaxis protein CheA [Ferrovum sp.]